MNQRDNVTHELISAYLDGEVSGDERARAEQLLSADHEHRQVLEDMQALSKDMSELPSYRLDEQFAQRVMGAARKVDPTVVDEPPARPRTGAPSWRWQGGAAVVVTAAALVLLAFFLNEPATNNTPSGERITKVQPTDSGRTDGKQPTRPLTPLSDNHVGDAPQQDAPPQDDERSMAKAATTSVATESARSTDQVGPESGGDAVVSASGDSLSPKQDAIAKSSREDRQLDQVPENGANNSANSVANSVKPKIEVGPGRMSQKILLVIDVQLTKQACEAGQFEQLLLEEGVAFDTSAKVQPELEKSLLESRFFEPLDKNEAGQRPPFTLVFVVSRSGAIDRVWQRMQQDPADFSRVSLDMALHPNDAKIFGRLHALSDVAALQAGEKNGVALPLELSPTWNGVPVDRSADKDGWGPMLSNQPRGNGGNKSTPQEDADRQFSGHLTEAIFVVHGVPGSSN